MSRKFKVSAYQVTKVLQKQNVIPVVSEYDDQDVKDWNECYECGETMSSIARAYGVKVSDVSKNITSKRSLKQEFRQAVKAKVLELYKAGKTVTDSAVGAGCSAPTARKYVREAGLMRPAKKIRVMQIAEDHSAGMGLQELSAKYRVSEKMLPNLIAAANRSL